MFDAVVVGARCAGAPLAMLLARAGKRVALVDRVAFPSDTLSTHFLWPRGVAMLADWDLLGELVARGCRPIPEIIFDVGPVQLRGTGGPCNGVTDSYCPRRTVLDTLLVEAATRSGAELIEWFTVEDVAWSAGRAVGVTGHRRGSTQRSRIDACVVLGADGLRSTIAASVGAEPYVYDDPLTCVYFGYWSSVSDQPATFYSRDGQLILTWPTNDELTCVYVAWPAAEFRAVRLNPQRAFHAAVQQVPHLAERLTGARQETPLRGTRALPNLNRPSAGAGWALLGDAGHHKDPCTCMGMTDAFISAGLLARRLTAEPALAEAHLDATLACYQQERDAATARTSQLTLKTARLAPPSPRLAALYEAAAEQAHLAEQIFQVLGGLRPISDLYTAPTREPLCSRRATHR